MKMLWVSDGSIDVDSWDYWKADLKSYPVIRCTNVIDVVKTAYIAYFAIIRVSDDDVEKYVPIMISSICFVSMIISAYTIPFSPTVGDERVSDLTWYGCGAYGVPINFQTFTPDCLFNADVVYPKYSDESNSTLNTQPFRDLASAILKAKIKEYPSGSRDGTYAHNFWHKFGPNGKFNNYNSVIRKAYGINALLNLRRTQYGSQMWTVVSNHADEILKKLSLLIEKINPTGKRIMAIKFMDYPLISGGNPWIIITCSSEIRSEYVTIYFGDSGSNITDYQKITKISDDSELVTDKIIKVWFTVHYELNISVEDVTEPELFTCYSGLKITKRSNEYIVETSNLLMDVIDIEQSGSTLLPRGKSVQGNLLLIDDDFYSIHYEQSTEYPWLQRAWYYCTEEATTGSDKQIKIYWQPFSDKLLLRWIEDATSIYRRWGVPIDTSEYNRLVALASGAYNRLYNLSNGDIDIYNAYIMCSMDRSPVDNTVNMTLYCYKFYDSNPAYNHLFEDRYGYYTYVDTIDGHDASYGVNMCHWSPDISDSDYSRAYCGYIFKIYSRYNIANVDLGSQYILDFFDTGFKSRNTETWERETGSYTGQLYINGYITPNTTPTKILFSNYSYRELTV